MMLKRRHVTSSQIVILCFAAVILLCSLLLTLPVASRDGHGASFGDALFTATSAVCVTGLVVRDTAASWSPFGQAVILLFIQIGGMGVITLAIASAQLSGRRVSLRQRSVMQEAASAHEFGGVVRLAGFIVRSALVAELLGAALLAPSFVRSFGVGKGIWYGVFHSVSAFCNAGFDLMGEAAPYSSLTAYSADPVINLVIMALIISGGLGFLTWDDIRRHKNRFHRFGMQSKVVLTATAALILVPAAYFYGFEYAHLSGRERVLAALFQAVTPRTAGFNTTDLTAMSETGQMVMILMMLIGGSPGSTAGGMKTTTFAVLVCAAISVFRRRAHVHFFGRRLDEDVIRSAAAIMMMYVALFLSGGMIISRVEGLPLLTCLFETASAVGTVGLTLGITPQLGRLSRAVLMALMFFGRAGALTLMYAAIGAAQGSASRLPMEKITVG